MSETEPSLRALASTWAAERIASGDATDGRDTLRPPEAADSAVTVDEIELPTLSLGRDGGELELRGSLGAGGMAVVERAWQRSLGREVAVKQARDPRSRSQAMMVREARVAGSLEHPNIVPVHALGRDEDGNAVIVMKRVSGESWHALLRDPSHPLWGEGDRLARNLEILTSVCRALELAHSRGWLHRDVKSENVMIGEFGEVYLLDWGIAVPLAIAERGEAVFAGTPSCMAPEMAAAATLTVATDVYLLGGVLHEILSGEPLHQGDNLQALLYAAMTPRARRYPAEAPPELVTIARRATEYHPADRFADVASFRRALARFVVHRDAMELAERATLGLDAVDAGATDDPRAAWLEARGILQQSLLLWPDADNRRAHAGLDRCLRGLVERELAEGYPSAAAGWAAQLSPRDAALDARIARESEARAAKARELEALRGWAADHDVLHSARLRGRRALAFAAVFMGVGVAGGAALRAGWLALGYAELSALQVGIALATIPASVVGARQQNKVSRWIGRVMMVAALTPFLSMALTWRLGLAAEASLAVDALVKAGGAAVLGAFVERSFLAVAAINLGTAAILAAFPGTFPIEIASFGLVLALLLVAWGLRARAPEASVG